MRARWRQLLVTGAVLTCLAAGAGALEAQCTGGQDLFFDLLEAHVATLAATSLPEALQKEVLQQLEAGTSNADGMQGATTSSSGLVGPASFPSLISAAFENGLMKNEENAISFDLNAFLFLSLAHPEVRKLQSQYDHYKTLRRFGGSLVFGGTGETFDRDGDGKPDKPPKLDRRTDIAKLEVQFRLTSASRDLREGANAAAILGDVHAAQLRDAELTSQFIRMFSPPTCMTETEFKEYVERESINQKLVEIAKATADMIIALDKGRQAVLDRRIWTLFAGRTERKEEQGRNVWTAGLRGDLGNASVDVTWARSENNGLYNVNAETAKAGLKYSRTPASGLLKNCEISGSASFEYAIDSSEAKYKTIAKANTGFSIPISKGIKLPISISWANHKDLLTGEKDIRGHIGFTIDWSKLVEPPKKDT